MIIKHVDVSNDWEDLALKTINKHNYIIQDSSINLTTLNKNSRTVKFDFFLHNIDKTNMNKLHVYILFIKILQTKKIKVQAITIIFILIIRE